MAPTSSSLSSSRQINQQQQSTTFRPGSIFYEPPTPTPHPPPHDTSPATPAARSGSSPLTETESLRPAPLKALGATAGVPLVSPPPSPSRNSIFDQPWSPMPGPNISSLRPRSSSHVSHGVGGDQRLCVRSGSTPLTHARSDVTGPAQSSPLSSSGPYTHTPPLGGPLARSHWDHSSNSSSQSSSTTIGNGGSSYINKILRHKSSSSSIQESTVPTPTRSLLPSATTDLSRPRRSPALEPATTQPCIQDMFTPSLPRQGQAHCPQSLLSPLRLSQLSPSSSCTSPTTPSLQLPSLALPEVVAPTGPGLFPWTEDGEYTFSLGLDPSRQHELGHGRHAEVYRALIHPTSAPMRQYLLARRAVKGLSCKDLFQGPGNVAQPCASSDRSNHDADSFVCAAKCLHADPDSQAFGLVEADILARLHSPHQQTLHPGRQFIVGYLGLCDRRTKQGMLTWISDSDSMLLDMDGEETPSQDRDQPPPSLPPIPEGELALILEYCQDGSIWDWIRQHPEKVDFRQWLTWAIQLTEAVDYLHNTGLVHHDIKPHNILLDSNLTAKLSDFGAGRFLPKGHGQLRDQRFSVEDGLGRGTPPYSAPEMFASSSMASEATYGPAIDIYSLGVSLYVIGLTAQEPFHKLKSTLEMIVWIRKGGFWLWEDQGWVHDRGPVPKVTMATRQSSMPSATQSPTLTHINVQNPTKSYSEKMASGRIASTARPISLASLAPAPIDTHIVYDGHWTSGTTTMSSPQPMNTDDFIPQDDSQHRSHSPTVPPFSYRGQGHSHLNHFQHMAGPSPDPVIRTPMLPTTPVSPVPLPSPIIRAQALRSSSASTRREEPQPRRSGETVMRFLNGEVVQHEVVQLLKDMCHPDVDRRPDSSQVLARLRELERMTMDYQEE